MIPVNLPARVQILLVVVAVVMVAVAGLLLLAVDLILLGSCGANQVRKYLHPAPAISHKD